MNIEDCANGSCLFSEKAIAIIGGAVAGFFGMKLWKNRARLTEIRKIKSNPGLSMTIDGVSYFLLVEDMPEGSYAVYAERPYSETTDYVGFVTKVSRGFRAFPPEKYGFGVKTDLPSFITERGTLLRTLRKAVGYLGKPYSRALRKSRSYIHSPEVGSGMLGLSE